MGGLLLDYLVGKRVQLERDVEVKHLGGLEVENEFETGRLHDRQIGRPFTLEDSASVRSCLAIRVFETGSIAHQPTFHDVISRDEACWNAMPPRQRDNHRGFGPEKRI